MDIIGKSSLWTLPIYPFRSEKIARFTLIDLLHHPLLFAFMAMALCVSYAFVGPQFIDHDAYAFAKVAEAVLNGKVLYRETWIDRAPLAILFYTVPQFLSRGSVTALQVWLCVWICLTALIPLLFVPSNSRRAGSQAALVLVALGLTDLRFAWANTENASNLFVTLTLFGSLRILRSNKYGFWLPVVVGASVACSFYVRQTSLFVALVPLASVFVKKCQTQVRQRILWLGILGFVLVNFLVLGFVVRYCDLNGFFYTVFLFPRSLVHLISPGYTSWSFLRSFFISPNGIFLACGLVGGFRKSFGQGDSGWIFQVVAVFAGIGMCLSPRKDHYHYWAQVTPIAALLFFIWVEPSLQFHNKKTLNPLPCFLILFLLFMDGRAVKRLKEWYHFDRDYSKRICTVAKEIDRIGGMRETLFVVGRGDLFLYFSSKLSPAHLYFPSFILNRFYSVLPESVEEIVSNYSASPPMMIAVQDSEIEEIKNPVGAEKNTRKIFRELNKKHPYREVAYVEGWRILRRD